MPANKTTPNHAWTVAAVKARLSEVLRLSEEEGPQRIGTMRPHKPLGQWLVENVPRGTNLEVPDRRSHRSIPFFDETGE